MYRQGRTGFAYAEEDELDNDDGADTTADEASVAEEGGRLEDDDSDDGKLSASPDAETTILFTKPAGAASSGILTFIHQQTNRFALQMVLLCRFACWSNC